MIKKIEDLGINIDITKNKADKSDKKIANADKEIDNLSISVKTNKKANNKVTKNTIANKQIVASNKVYLSLFSLYKTLLSFFS